jgi:hypothetical protein
MSRSGLKFFAIFLSALIVVVLFAGLDDLPRDLHKRIGAERATLAAAQSRVRGAREEVNRNLQAEAALFSGIASSKQWPDRLGQADGQLQEAARDMDALARLEKADRRQDRQQAESLLSDEGKHRATATQAAEAVRKEAAHWIDLKQHLPQALQQMERDYGAVRGFNLAGAEAAARKAATDWPEKQADLEARLTAQRDLAAQAETAWQSTADARKRAAAGDFAGLDYGGLFAAADRLQTAAADLPKKAGEIQALSGQLYYSWDKILVDMETRGIGSSKEYDQKLRTIKTQLADASTKNGATTSEERWVDVPRATFESMRGNLGMAVEHKAAGKYDFEAERVAQPAGFAYMAPPGQSNRYGQWEHRDGRDFWVFYGQYALMRDLLFNRDYRPLDRGDWDGYRNSQNRGQTYYGNDSGGQKYGTAGTATQQRYSGSSYGKSGGFKDSQFASKSGGFRDSQYASPATRKPDMDQAPRSFGRNASPSSPRASPPPARSYRPAPSPRPSFRMPSGGSGRRFGRR